MTQHTTIHHNQHSSQLGDQRRTLQWVFVKNLRLIQHSQSVCYINYEWQVLCTIPHNLLWYVLFYNLFSFSCINSRYLHTVDVEWAIISQATHPKKPAQARPSCTLEVLQRNNQRTKKQKSCIVFHTPSKPEPQELLCQKSFLLQVSA